MLKRLAGVPALLLAASVLLVALPVAPAMAQTAVPPNPAQDPLTGNAALDNIYYGSIPPTNPQGPVLLFVHGLGGIAPDWWTGDLSIQGQNDMYLLAYAAGYRTAFVTLNLNGNRGPGNDMWVNGQTLSQQISQVTKRYGVDQVDIVAHSKGGIDAQTAIVYYGSAPKVRRVFSLSTPYQGAEVADFAAAFTGSTFMSSVGISLDDSVRTLSPTYMAQYRAQTDAIISSPNAPTGVAAIKWYCAAGDDTAPPNGALNFIQVYLSQFGPNDGMITVASACLTYATRLFVQPYHHFIMNVGHNSFPWVQGILVGGTPSASVVPPALVPLPAIQNA
jgi:pimeloyl-ACP methyl ester carboxylesterase